MKTFSGVAAHVRGPTKCGAFIAGFRTSCRRKSALVRRRTIAVAMKPKTYIETTIVGYLAGSPSRDVVVAGHQQITQEWWGRRGRFELFVSEAVVQEAMRGDAVAAVNQIDYLLTWNCTHIAKAAVRGKI